MFFPPEINSEQSFDGLGLLQLDTADGEKLSVQHIKNTDAQFTLLYSHGNAEDLRFLQPLFARVAKLGFSIAAYDYPGYGLSTGVPSEASANQAILRVYRYLVEEQNVLPQSIIVLGRSLGSGPSLHLVSQKAVGGLILESAFLSAGRVLTGVPVLMVDKFENIDLVKNVDVPVMVIHGKDDHVISFRHGKTLFEHAPEPKRIVVFDSGHNDLVASNPSEYFKSLTSFSELIVSSQNNLK